MIQRHDFDAILGLVNGRKAVGEKLVKHEGLIEGHFPGRPIQPGILTLDGLIELAKHLIAEEEGVGQKVPACPKLLRIEKARFLEIVTPGERLVLEVEVTRRNGNEARFKGRALVGERLKAEAIFVLLLSKNGIER